VVPSVDWAITRALPNGYLRRLFSKPRLLHLKYFKFAIHYLLCDTSSIARVIASLQRPSDVEIPKMPIPFGIGVGDFIAVGGLIVKVVQEIKEVKAPL
jgi:hypothetical protein